MEASEQATAIDTTTAQIQSTFESKQISELPSASTGSGVINLSLLNAGVASSGGIGVRTGPSISGQRPRNNHYTVEGVDNNSKSVPGPLMQIPNEAVDNFTVLQNQFSPEFGHSSGGQFNHTIRSGTNQFHGRLYEYFQNRELNAIDSQNALAQVSNGQTPFNPRYATTGLAASLAARSSRTSCSSSPTGNTTRLARLPRPPLAHVGISEVMHLRESCTGKLYVQFERRTEACAMARLLRPDKNGDKSKVLPDCFHRRLLAYNGNLTLTCYAVRPSFFRI